MTSMVRKNASRVAASVLCSRRAKKRSCTSRPRAMTGCAFAVHSSWVLRRGAAARPARHGAALQIPLLHQTVHVHRHKVRFDLADLHDIPGGGAVRVVCQKHQDIKGSLGQLEFLTQRLAHGIVGLRGLEADLYGRVHGMLLLFLYGQFIFEVL